MGREMASVYIKKGEARALKSGGLWIYDNEIERAEGTLEAGDLVQVFDFDGYPLGTGFMNPHSKIAIRMLTRKKRPSLMPPLSKRVSALPGSIGKPRSIRQAAA